MKKLVGLFVMSFLLTMTIAGLLLSGVKIDKVQAQSIESLCPTEDITNTQCQGPKDCLYPNPKNCNTYIQCTVNNDGMTGTPVVMPCPGGLQWNDNQKICDWPNSSTCPS
ncbi:MAG: carbohydrate-binding module family 14 protein [Nostoc sp.]|uniref:carbohydrate-binding module family 14 protein n=1 Tax=Nostoc sp. TaxID=1180 RepID=UPI002FF9403B